MHRTPPLVLLLSPRSAFVVGAHSAAVASAVRTAHHPSSRRPRLPQSALRTADAAAAAFRAMSSAAASSSVARPASSSSSSSSTAAFTIEHACSASAARAGLLRTRGAQAPLPTPNAFFYSRKGNMAHLTPDLLHKVPLIKAINVNVPELIAAPGIDGIRHYKGRLHEYSQLQNHILYLSVRDPLVDGLGSSNENGVSVLAAQGSTRISAAQYGALAREYAPDIVASISDEVSSTVASNRARKASQRSVMWADEMIAALNVNNKDAPQSRPLFFASIQGGADLEQRATSCSEYSRRAAESDAATAAGRSGLASIDGFVIGGLGSGEDPAKRGEIISAVVSALPTSKPRVLSSSSGLHGQPDEVLSAVERGIDLFEVEYPHQLTLLGQASVMWIGDDAIAVASNLPPSDRPQTKLHLRDSRYAHDQAPILKGCGCFTCKNHTRAYLHHLLNVHEMTAPILIDLHNLFHYSRFLAAIRASLASGSFVQFKQQFLQRFLPAPSAAAAGSSAKDDEALMHGGASVTLAAPPLYAHQVGRGLLGPSAPIVAQVGSGAAGQPLFNIRRILPKDESQVAALIREVLPSFGAVGPGYATADPELDWMWRAYETNMGPPMPAAAAAATKATEASAAADQTMTDAPVAAPAAAAAFPPVFAPPPRSAYFVITRPSDDSVVLGGGGVAMLAGTKPEEAVCELRKMYLLPATRGQGVGHKLIEIIMEQARALGFKGMYLETLPNMKQAHALYAKNGFKRLDQPMGCTGHFSCQDRFYRDL